jgi:putative ABC transport system permease protein
MLLVGAGLALRSAFNLTSVPIGVRLDRVLTFGLALDAQVYPSLAARREVREMLVERLSALPGADVAHAVDALPVLEDGRLVSVRVDNRFEANPLDRPWALATGIDEGVLAALDVSLLTGRWFTRDQVARDAPVALIGRETAVRYYGSAAAAEGRAITVSDGGADRVYQVVGVVGDVLGRDLERGPQPRIWLPLGDTRRVVIVMTTHISPAELSAAVWRTVAEVAPQVPVERLDTYANAFARFRASDYVVIGVFTGFALLALLLAATGLYGVIAYTVSQRTAEFGTRLALGAQIADVMLMIVRQSMKLVIVGLVAGISLGWMLGQAMRSVLFSVSPLDLSNLASVVAVLTLVALAASIFPAMRAARVDIVQAIRTE